MRIPHTSPQKCHGTNATKPRQTRISDLLNGCVNPVLKEKPRIMGHASPHDIRAGNKARLPRPFYLDVGNQSSDTSLPRFASNRPGDWVTSRNNCLAYQWKWDPTLRAWFALLRRRRECLRARRRVVRMTDY